MYVLQKGFGTNRGSAFPEEEYTAVTSCKSNLFCYGRIYSTLQSLHVVKYLSFCCRMTSLLVDPVQAVRLQQPNSAANLTSTTTKYFWLSL